MAITLFLSLPSKRVPDFHLLPPCSITLILFRHDLFFQPNSAVIFCHSQISLICLIYPSLPNLYFYTIRSITMFLKVLNKVNFRELTPLCSGFITCMGACVTAVKLDNVIWFSTLFRMSGFLWHGSKWACWFGHFLQDVKAWSVSM